MTTDVHVITGCGRGGTPKIKPLCYILHVTSQIYLLISKTENITIIEYHSLRKSIYYLYLNLWVKSLFLATLKKIF